MASRDGWLRHQVKPTPFEYETPATWRAPRSSAGVQLGAGLAAGAAATAALLAVLDPLVAVVGGGCLGALATVLAHYVAERRRGELPEGMSLLESADGRARLTVFVALQPHGRRDARAREALQQFAEDHGERGERPLVGIQGAEHASGCAAARMSVRVPGGTVWRLALTCSRGAITAVLSFRVDAGCEDRYEWVFDAVARSASFGGLNPRPSQRLVVRREPGRPAAATSSSSEARAGT